MLDKNDNEGKKRNKMSRYREGIRNCNDKRLKKSSVVITMGKFKLC